MDLTDVTLPVLLQRATGEMTQPGTNAGVVKDVQFTHRHTHTPGNFMYSEKERLLNRPVGIVGRTPLSRGGVKKKTC